MLAGCSGEDAAPEAAAPTSAPVPAVSSSAPVESPAAVDIPHTLVFSATGTAAVTSVTYEYDGEKVTEKPDSLPWRKTVEVPADGRRHTWSLELKHGSGQVELIAIFDGDVTGRTQGSVSGGGSGTAKVGGSVRG